MANPLKTLAILICTGDAGQAGLEKAHFVFIVPACLPTSMTRVIKCMDPLISFVIDAERAGFEIPRRIQNKGIKLEAKDIGFFDIQRWKDLEQKVASKTKGFLGSHQPA